MELYFVVINKKGTRRGKEGGGAKNKTLHAKNAKKQNKQHTASNVGGVVAVVVVVVVLSGGVATIVCS
jgi:uncharacterized membrane protein YkgB